LNLIFQSVFLHDAVVDWVLVKTLCRRTPALAVLEHYGLNLRVGIVLNNCIGEFFGIVDLFVGRDENNGRIPINRKVFKPFKKLPATVKNPVCFGLSRGEKVSSGLGKRLVQDALI